MADIAVARVKSGAKLLKALLKKLDNGDQVLTEAEISRAVAGSTRKVRMGKDGKPIPYIGKDGKPLPIKKPTVDGATLDALLAAVRKKKSASDRSITGILVGVDEALAEVTAVNVDRSKALGAVEQKKVKSTLGKKLMEFSRLHGEESASSFHFLSSSEDVYVPSTPFRLPKGASPEEIVEALMKHYNAFSNDNRSGPGPDAITRYVIGDREAKGVTEAIAAMPATTARAVLKALSKRVRMADDRGAGFKPQRIWLDAKGLPIVEKLAAKLGVKASFRGDPKAPYYDYW